MVWIGVDIGSLTVKVVAVDADGRLSFAQVAPAGRSGVAIAENLLEGMRRGDVKGTVVTGYGRVTFAGADGEVSEITCHARGACHVFGDVRTVIDVGGQDSKAMRLDGSGRVQQFAMNDRCAAGTGRFLEVMAGALEVGVAEFSALAESAAHPVALTSTCTVFAESEVIGHLNSGAQPEAVAAGVAEAMAGRVAGLALQVGVEPRVVMTGGVARNGAVVAALGRRLGVSVDVPEDPELMGALGAALIARERFA